MKRLAFAVLGCLSICLLSGCNGDGGDAQGTAPGGKQVERGTIGVSLLTLDNPFFKVIGDNITAEGKKHGYSTTVLSADKDAAKQNDQIKTFIVEKVAAIVLSPCESKAVVPAIKAANEAGIPVITVDIPCDEGDIEILTQIATDNFGGGEEAGRAIVEVLGDTGGKVAVLHFEQAESCRLRVAGFKKVIDAHNENAENKIVITNEYASGGAKDQGFTAAEAALQTDPDLKAIFAINDPAALGARAALEKHDKTRQVAIVGFDGQPEGKQAIKDGKIYADPIQFPDQMGIKVVESIVAYFNGDEVPAEQLIPTKLYKREDAENDPELK